LYPRRTWLLRVKAADHPISYAPGQTLNDAGQKSDLGSLAVFDGGLRRDDSGRPSVQTERYKGRGRKEAHQVTDRALRYRANACPPPGAPICCLCGSTRNVEVGHVNGHEEDDAPANLFWTCRSCNVISGNALRDAGIGRPTRQYNPATQGAKTLGQWLTAVTSMKGESDAMAVDAAVEMIRATPPARRSGFASEIWARRRQHGTDQGTSF
jgi:5-methylcytosine-specific restriction endonuclease McrA